MACASKIAAAIANTCTIKPSAGVEVKAWAINRVDATFTIDGSTETLCTGIALSGATVAYPITAVKKEMNVGADAVISDNLPNCFKHYFSFQPYGRSGANIKAMDDMTDIVIVAELKGKKTQGCFAIFGMETGLHPSGMSFRANDNNGIPTYEFATLDGEEESHSRYVFWSTDYATSLAALVALET
jgi:hypothetical protein